MLYAQTSAVRFVETGFPIEVSVERSGTHFHPSKEIEAACGGFTIARELSVAGEFVARERVAIYITRLQCIYCPILLPAREYTQVEMSISDQLRYKLTKSPTVTFSGQPSETHVSISLPRRDEGLSRHNVRNFENIPVIVAVPHIHLPRELYQAEEKFNLVYESKLRSGRIHLVAHPNDIPHPTIHLDNDEWNAANLNQAERVRLV